MKKNSTALSLLMIVILVLASTLLITYGAQLTQRVQAESESELNDRSIRLYFNNRFKQNDILDAISTDESTLIIDLDSYYILIYEENNELIEQVSTDPIRYDNGEVIAYASNFKLDYNSNLISITYTNINGELITLNYLVQAGKVYE